jgi:hypothetical protein
MWYHFKVLETFKQFIRPQNIDEFLGNISS